MRIVFGIGALVLAAALLTHGAHAADTAPLVQRLEKAKGEGNYGFLNVLKEKLADPAQVLHDGKPVAAMSRQQVVDGGVADLEALAKGLPDFKCRILSVAAKGDLIAVSYTWEGTTPDGKKLDARKQGDLVVKDGIITAFEIHEDAAPEKRELIRAIFKQYKVAPKAAAPK
jgi:hypothetical protein